MANPEHVETVRQGAAAILEWRRQNPGATLDLRRAELSTAELRGANLSDAHLNRANLTGAYLIGADLFGVKLRRADLQGAFLTTASLVLAQITGADLTGARVAGANLSFANLTGSNLDAADLRAAGLIGANLIGANLAEARLDSTSLAACDLSQVKGLSTVNPEGPSSIGVDTLIRSFRGAGNKLTPDLETFFLGAGVPRELLAALPQIVAEVKYHSCFICYGQPDLDFATRLCDDLERRGVPCWLYDLDKTPGEPTWREIAQKRREADKMVVICSAKALIRPGALKEIEEQIDEDPDKMIPISRDKLWMERGFRVERGTSDLKPFLLDKNYADFSDDSRYDKELQRLLKALRRKGE